MSSVCRMSSTIFPWCTEYNVADLPDYGGIRDALKFAGDLARACVPPSVLLLQSQWFYICVQALVVLFCVHAPAGTAAAQRGLLLCCVLPSNAPHCITRVFLCAYCAICVECPCLCYQQVCI